DRRKLANESGDADVLEADRVQHARRRLGDADGRVAAAGREAGGLCDYGAEALNIEGLEVDAVSEGARSDHNGDGENEAMLGGWGQVDGEVQAHCRFILYCGGCAPAKDEPA